MKVLLMQIKELKTYYNSGFVQDVTLEEVGEECFQISCLLKSGQVKRLYTSKSEEKIYKSIKAAMNEIKGCSIDSIKLKWNA